MILHAQKTTIVLKRDIVMLAACSYSFPEVIYAHLAGNHWVFVRRSVTPEGSREITIGVREIVARIDVWLFPTTIAKY